MAQEVDNLLSKCEALSSNPNTARKKEQNWAAIFQEEQNKEFELPAPVSNNWQNPDFWCKM
jgi:hypothetical protein